MLGTLGEGRLGGWEGLGGRAVRSNLTHPSPLRFAKICQSNPPHLYDVLRENSRDDLMRASAGPLER